VDPVIWNEVTGNIVGGHQRYKVLTAEGATEIDCVVVHIENPQEEKALNIALNKAVGEWEPVALADLLNDLKLSGYDVDATGFDAAEIDDLFSKVHDKDVKGDDCDIDPEQVESVRSVRRRLAAGQASDDVRRFHQRSGRGRASWTAIRPTSS
jgi:ParB-like chromosome segregation protein Spo0J